MKKLLFLIFVLSATGAYSQNIKVNINNLQLWGKYKTAEEIFDALGQQPTKIIGPQPTDEEPNSYTFYFDNDIVNWTDGEISDAILKSDKFVINGMIRVGDNISNLKNLGGRTKDGVYKNAILWYPPSDTPIDGLEIRFHYQNDIITKIFICTLL